MRARIFSIGLALSLSIFATSCSDSSPRKDSFASVGQANDAGPHGSQDSAAPPETWDAAGWDANPSQPDKNPGPPYPIVLHHGFSGWEETNVVPVHYFYDVAPYLRAHGQSWVFETTVEPYHATEVRAKQLAPQIDEILRKTGKDKVNIIAHSQGGLDARYLISSMGYGDRVASLSTVSTPHRGTRLGEALLKLTPDWSDGLINAAADVLGKRILNLNTDSDMKASLRSLSEGYVRGTFNPNNPNDARVAYYSYAGRSNDSRGEDDCKGSWLPNPDAVDHIDPLLKITGNYLKKPGENVHCPGGVCANDGIVTVQSARWGLFMGCFPADHFDEVGQIAMKKPNKESGYDQRVFYLSVVKHVRSEGF